MTEPCHISACFEPSTEAFDLVFANDENLTFTVRVCQAHGEGFRSFAGTDHIKDTGFGDVYFEVGFRD